MSIGSDHSQLSVVSSASGGGRRRGRGGSQSVIQTKAQDDFSSIQQMQDMKQPLPQNEALLVDEAQDDQEICVVEGNVRDIEPD